MRDEGLDPATYARAWDRAQSLLKRRQAASSLGLGVNTALLAAMAFVMRGEQLAILPRMLVIGVLLSAGIIACLHWMRSLQAYQRLMSWWYVKLRELEERLEDPRDRLATAEYDALYGPKVARDQRVSLTTHEMTFIKLLLGLHGVFAAIAFAFTLGAFD